VVGQPTNEDASIGIASPASNPVSAFSNGTISLAASSLATMSVTINNLAPQPPDLFDLTLTLLPRPGQTGPVTNWTVLWTVPTPTGPDPKINTGVSITTPRQCQFRVSPQPGATAAARLQLKVHRQGAAATLVRTMNFDLTRL